MYKNTTITQMFKDQCIILLHLFSRIGFNQRGQPDKGVL